MLASLVALFHEVARNKKLVEINLLKHVVLPNLTISLKKDANSVAL